MNWRALPRFIAEKPPGQVLITTLLVLMLISITIISITATARRTGVQVFNNLEYEKSYNDAETRVIQGAEVLSRPELNFSNIEAELESAFNPSELDTCSVASGVEATCTFKEPGGERRTVMQIKEVNYVENYELGKEDYFDIILTNKAGGGEYRKAINLSWIGDTAIELTLVYDIANELRNTSQIINSRLINGQRVYNQVGSSSGFLDYAINPDIIGNNLNIDLSRLKASEIPGGAILKYLRVKTVNRDIGSSITIRPDPTAESSFPNQVRRIETFSYNILVGESSAPVVVTQLPLSPPVPAPLSFALSLDSVRTPICGNGIAEGREQCDDRNTNNDDACHNDCTEPPLVKCLDPNNITTRAIPLKFAKDDEESCNWGRNGNNGREESVISAREERKISIPIAPDEILCGLKLEFPVQKIRYDDTFTLTMNDRVLMTNENFWNRFPGIPISKLYNWDALKGTPGGDRNYQGLRCIGNVNRGPDCDLPRTDEDGQLKLNISKDLTDLLAQEAELQGRYELWNVITGDNDSSDCRLPYDLKLTAIVEVAAR